MTNQKTIDISTYAPYINHLGALLKLSRHEVRKRYRNCPLCLMHYIEKNVHAYITEIRFDEDEVTLSCVFDADDKCTSVYLFPDNNEIIEDLTDYMNTLHKFDYINNKWDATHYYVKVKELERENNNIFLAFYHK